MLLLAGTAIAMLVGGMVICIVGMTTVFVPQDLEFMGTTPVALQALNPRLIPLIAHDRAGFGGVVFNIGLVLLFCLWNARPSRSFHQALGLAGAIGFTSAIGIHLIVGYINPTHMAPACLGAAAFAAGMILMVWKKKRERNSAPPFRGWIFFDGSCGMCSTMRTRWGPLLEPRGFRMASLQEPWVQKRLGLAGEISEEMKLQLPDGRIVGGADVFVQIARFVWWAWPLWLLGQAPRGPALLRIVYRAIAKHRYATSRICRMDAVAVCQPHVEKWLN
jgi:predicted DCC family thiol-disulfide oxidoreductase YuxK